jgi:ATP-dependent Clp protease ATP-binding subunit ClpC
MVLTGYKAGRTLIPMFERFTNAARRVVVQAQEEARKLQHNYIGTEHLLLGLLTQPDELAARALGGLGISLDGTRQEVRDVVGVGKNAPAGHIPFTPRAKKTLELSLREALQLRHEYIGTEHILLGLIKEGEGGGRAKGEGVAAKILQEHAELPAVRDAVLTLLASDPAEKVYERRWLRRVTTARPATAAELGALPAPGTEQAVLSATPAADATLSGAARLAGSQPVGSHHLLLASLADPRTAAARALAALGLNLEHAREALLDMDVTGTSDELPEDAGRRRMRIRVIGDQLRLEADDPVLVQAGRDAIAALGDEEKETGTIPGQLPVSASLSRVWQALLESLADIQRRATLPAEPPVKPSADPSAGSSAESSAKPPNGPLSGPAGESPAGPDTPDS